MRFRLPFSAFLVLFISLSSCDKVDTVAPVETQRDSLMEPPQSVIVVPVSYGVKDLQTMINAKLKPVLLQKWMTVGENKDSLYLEIRKMGEIKIRRKEKTLIYDVPVKISGKYIASVGGFKIKNATPVSTNLILH